MNSAQVIAGEAPETDSEDESLSSLRNNEDVINHGSVIIGEDSESETESNSTVNNVESTLSSQYTSPDGSKKVVDGTNFQNESLLHKKLKECNHQFYTVLNSFCQNAVSQAGKTLSAVDSDLVRSQTSLQSAITALRRLNSDSSVIQDQLNFIISSNFIANIKTN